MCPFLCVFEARLQRCLEHYAGDEPHPSRSSRLVLHSLGSSGGLYILDDPGSPRVVDYFPL